MSDISTMPDDGSTMLATFWLALLVALCSAVCEHIVNKKDHRP
jgi:hypothetical protein